MFWVTLLVFLGSLNCLNSPMTLNVVARRAGPPRNHRLVDLQFFPVEPFSFATKEKERDCEGSEEVQAARCLALLALETC